MAIGYVLVSVGPGQEFAVYQKVKALPEVVDATLLFGEYDLIARLQADEMQDIARLVVEQIRQIEGVSDTKTLAGAEL